MTLLLYDIKAPKGLLYEQSECLTLEVEKLSA
jgi:hypothetical protein